MGNPYAPIITRAQGQSLPLARLRALGATEEVLAEVGKRWAEMTPDEREASAAQLAELSDAEVGNELRAMADGLTSARLADPVPEASVPELLAWVGDDTEKAQRALDAEKAKPSPRKTALDGLERVIGG